MSETVERIYPEAVNLRSMARWERKQGNLELAGVLEGTADLYERTASDLESATKSLGAHQRAVIEQHAEITTLRAQLEEARAKAIEEAALVADKNAAVAECSLDKGMAEMIAMDIRALNGSANKEGGKS